MDIRAFGKGYEEFYRSAKAMGIEFVKGKVARLTEDDDQGVIVRVERIDQFGQVEERKHDLVVLSLGMRPAEDLTRLARARDRRRTASSTCRGPRTRPAARRWTASSWPAPRPARRTSSTPSSRPARPRPRRPSTCASGRDRLGGAAPRRGRAGRGRPTLADAEVMS